MINAIKFSIEEIEASDQYFDHTGYAALPTRMSISLRSVPKSIGLVRSASAPLFKSLKLDIERCDSYHRARRETAPP